MKKTWTRVVLESPYAGEVEENRIYALACLRDMFNRGEAGFASHLLYPRFLEAYNNRERAEGITAGHVWVPAAHKVVVYTDLGLSGGMVAGIKVAEEHGVPIERRKLGWTKQ